MEFRRFRVLLPGPLALVLLVIPGVGGVQAAKRDRDATPPKTWIASGPSEVAAGATARFTFRASERGATFQCRLDRGDWTRCRSPLRLTPTVGQHELRVRARDRARNTDRSPARRGFTVTPDASPTPPVVPDPGGPPATPGPDSPPPDPGAGGADATGPGLGLGTPDLFAADGVWRAPLAADAPIDPRSAAISQTLVSSVRDQARAGTGPGLTARARSPLYTAAPDTPLSTVRLDTGSWADDIAEVFAQGVPIPAGAQPSSGSDSSMAVWQPSTDTYWEFFQMSQALRPPQYLGEPSASAGGQLAAGSYSYSVTALNEGGETTAKKSPLTKSVADGGQIRIAWAPVHDATGYRVYRADGSGEAGLLATLPATDTSYTDSGSALPGATRVPTENTAATPGVWHASYGGRITSASTSPGYYRDVGDGNGGYTQRFGWGATATSLPLAGGMITKADVLKGRIDHALALGLPNLAGSSIIARDVWAFPAQRSDGKATFADAVPEGARFRLDPALDIDSLGLPPLTRILAEAAQRYGIVVQDGSAATVFYGEDPSPYERNGEPNFWTGPRSAASFTAFPWEQLELVRMSLCTDPRAECGS